MSQRVCASSGGGSHLTLARATGLLSSGLLKASFTLVAVAAGAQLIRTRRRWGPKWHGIDISKNNNHLTINVIILTFTKNGGNHHARKKHNIATPG